MRSAFSSRSPSHSRRLSRRKSGFRFFALLAGTLLAAVLLVAAGRGNDPLGLREHLPGYAWYARIVGEDRPAPPAGAVNAARSAITPEASSSVVPGETPSFPENFALSSNAAAVSGIHDGAEPESSPQAESGPDPAWLPLIARLEADGFSRQDMEALFARLGPSSWSPAFMAAKVTELTGISGVGVSLAEDALPELPEDYEQPVSAITVGEYKAFREKHAEDLAIIKQRYGVPGNVLTAILLVETGLGSNLGGSPALLALAGMASTTTPAMLGSAGNTAQIRRVHAERLKSILREKSAWAYKELKALIKYGQDGGADISKLPGSIYGAVGICQFMPSNIEPYGVDGDEDGVVNLFSVKDAMYSAANYLAEHGWRGAGSREQRFRVLLAYNQDFSYAGHVLGVSRQLALAEKGKMADHRNPMVGAGPAMGRIFDPSLRGRGRVPARARIKPLGSYQDILP